MKCQDVWVVDVPHKLHCFHEAAVLQHGEDKEYLCILTFLKKSICEWYNHIVYWCDSPHAGDFHLELLTTEGPVYLCLRNGLSVIKDGPLSFIELLTINIPSKIKLMAAGKSSGGFFLLVLRQFSGFFFVFRNYFLLVLIIYYFNKLKHLGICLSINYYCIYFLIILFFLKPYLAFLV